MGAENLGEMRREPDEHSGDGASYSRIDANGLTFGYLGAGQGPLVLCIHGFPDVPETFERLLGRLAETGYHAVAPATRGIYPTSVPPDADYSPVRLGQDVLALIEAFGEQTAVIIGHDWGAISAYAAANIDPVRVTKIVTIAIPHPRAIRMNFHLLRRGWHFALLSIPLLAEFVARRNDFALLDYLRRSWSPDMRPSTEQVARLKRSYREPGTLPAALGYYRALLPAFAAIGRSGKESHEILFRKTTVPALTFAGIGDGVFDEATFERTSEAFTGHYKLIKSKGGHFLHLEPFEQCFEQLVLDFLRLPVA
jgi:pimeloyl-ACP methyl ester carboxylesterase